MLEWLCVDPITHIHFMAIWTLSRITQVGRYQNQSGFTEARDSEWQWHHHPEMSHGTTTVLRPFCQTTGVSQYQKKHSPTQPIQNINHPLSASSIYYNPQHPPCSIYVLDSFYAQALQVLWSISWSGTLHFILHTFLHP